MNIRYYKEYSYELGREMEFKVFGHAGKPCLVFPAQNGRFYDFENFKMVDSVHQELEEGRLQLFCVDTVDPETWSSDADQSWRIGIYEAYVRYIVHELMGRIYQIHNETAQEDYHGKVLTTGCSMGATHALNFFLRFPDLFDGVIALSGVYHAGYFFPNYTDGRIYENSSLDTLQNIPWDHPYLEKYRRSQIIVCVGQGRWEAECLEDTRLLQQQLERLQVPAWIDYWGWDCDHDWPWWRKQFPYFIRFVIG